MSDNQPDAFLKIIDTGSTVKLYTNIDPQARPEMLYLAKIAELIIMNGEITDSPVKRQKTPGILKNRIGWFLENEESADD